MRAEGSGGTGRGVGEAIARVFAGRTVYGVYRRLLCNSSQNMHHVSIPSMYSIMPCTRRNTACWYIHTPYIVRTA